MGYALKGHGLCSHFLKNACSFVNLLKNDAILNSWIPRTPKTVRETSEKK
jgi:hypothetical protein